MRAMELESFTNVEVPHVVANGSNNPDSTLRVQGSGEGSIFDQEPPEETRGRDDAISNQYNDIEPYSGVYDFSSTPHITTQKNGDSSNYTMIDQPKS